MIAMDVEITKSHALRRDDIGRYKSLQEVPL